MRIYTSYWGKLKALGNHEIQPIGISRYQPKWYKGGTHFKMLSPTSNLLMLDEDEYVPKFEEILSKLNAKEIYSTLKQISKKDAIALICYERPEDFCHRHLVAKWLSKELDIEITEWEEPQKEAEKPNPNLTLF